jgi:hypothetical protein
MRIVILLEADEFKDGYDFLTIGVMEDVTLARSDPANRDLD